MDSFNMMFSNPWMIQLVGLELLLLLLFIVFGRLDRVYKRKGTAFYTPEQLVEKFGTPALSHVLGGVAGIAVLIYGWYWIVYELMKGYFSGFTGYVFFIEPPVWEFSLLIGGMLGMSSGIILSNSLALARWKDEYRNHAEMYSVMYGGNFDAHALSIVLAGLLICGTIPLTLVITDQYSAFFTNQIVINTATEWKERVYSYPDVKAVKHVQYRTEDNRRVLKPYYIIDFIDGYQWNSRYEGYDESSKDEKVAKYVSGRTGKKPVLWLYDKDQEPGVQ